MICNVLLAGERKYCSVLANHVYRAGFDTGMLMHENIMSGRSPVGIHMELTGENLATESKIRGQSTQVQFAGAQRFVQENMAQDCIKAYKNEKGCMKNRSRSVRNHG